MTDDYVQQYNSTVVSSTATASAVVNNNNSQVQYPDMHIPQTASNQHLRQALDMQQLNSSSLSAEQSQYFNSLSSQNSTQQNPNIVNSYQPVVSVQYSASPFATTNNYADQVVAGQQQAQSVANRNSKRARVPPPSKIPSTAVEMPVDTLNNIGYLDVQFGGLDFGTEESFDAISEKFQAASIVDNSQTVGTTDITNDYQQKPTVQQTATGGLQASQLTDSLSTQNDNLTTAGFNPRQANSVVSQSSAVSNTLNNASAGMYKFICLFKFR